MAILNAATDQQAEYFATSIKKIVVLSFLTLGYYNLRWYCTNFHRYVIAKTHLKTPTTRAMLTVLMYLCSIITLLLLTYDIKRQANQYNIKTWWHPITIYAVFITMGIASLPNNMPAMVRDYQLSALSYFCFYILTIALIAFIMATLQKTINQINEHKQLAFASSYRFTPIHIIAFVLAPFLWLMVAVSTYSHSLPPTQLAYMALQQGNYRAAINILKPISRQGDAKANLFLGQIYEKGLGVTKDQTIANNYYDQASHSKDPMIITLVARHYLETSRSLPKAINLLNRAAQQQFAPAINQLSLLYSTNKLIPADYQKAFHYAKQSADLGNSAGEFLLATLYYKQPNQPPNWSQYIKYLKKSATQGYPPAAYALALGYRDGNQVLAKDSQQAVKWFKVAADRQYPPAITELANAYHTGIGTKKNHQRAVKLYQAAAQQGDDIAQYNLGLAYANGLGIAQDEKQAINWYNKAAQQNNSCAINDLGILYSKGRGVAADDHSAMNYFLQAAKDGFSATSDQFIPLSTVDDLVTLERSKQVGIHHISPQQYQQAYVTYMQSIYSKNKASYQAQLAKLSPLALQEAKYLRQYYKLACWQ